VNVGVFEISTVEAHNEMDVLVFLVFDCRGRGTVLPDRTDFFG